MTHEVIKFKITVKRNKKAVIYYANTTSNKYGSETWPLRKTDKNKLLILKRKILRKIFGPTMDCYNRRMETKEQQRAGDNIYRKNILETIKKERLRCVS